MDHQVVELEGTDLSCNGIVKIFGQIQKSLD